MDMNSKKEVFHGSLESMDTYRKSMVQTLDFISDFFSKRSKVIYPLDINEVQQRISSIDLSFEKTIDLQECLNELHEIYLKDAAIFSHPQYFPFLNTPVLIPTLAAEAIINTMNNSMTSWLQNGGASFIEEALIHWTLNKIGYDINQSDGVFTSGGSQSNLMGLLMARNAIAEKHYPEKSIKKNGLPIEGSRFKIFCSKVSHFSIEKSANIMGLGYDAVIHIPTDEHLRMRMDALKEGIELEQQKGNIPIAIVATAGTTNFGSIDPIEEMSEIANQYDIWLHIDAAYGGGILVSNKYKELLKGIQMADSVTIDFHKTFFQSIGSSGFFVKEKHHFEQITYYADFLNPKQKQGTTTPDLLRKSLQTTRPFDALKLWFTLRILGEKKLETYLNHSLDLARETYEKLKEKAYYEILHKPQISTLVFRYKPSDYTSCLEVSKLNEKIYTTLLNQGDFMVGGLPYDDKFYLRIHLLNPTTTSAHIDALLKEIETIGKKNAALNPV